MTSASWWLILRGMTSKRRKVIQVVPGQSMHVRYDPQGIVMHLENVGTEVQGLVVEVLSRRTAVRWKLVPALPKRRRVQTWWGD